MNRVGLVLAIGGCHGNSMAGPACGLEHLKHECGELELRCKQYSGRYAKDALIQLRRL